MQRANDPYAHRQALEKSGKLNMQLISLKEEDIWLFSQSAGQRVLYDLVTFATC